MTLSYTIVGFSSYPSEGDVIEGLHQVNVTVEYISSEVLCGEVEVSFSDNTLEATGIIWI